ncbi:zinc-binding dehydrogenase [Microbacterium trichothecenolyticum]|uniref:zinc-binding dehydrogenase n=1 Tax=Microbacterium trichothecenolyticum TaxID=69370 RepID=UPI001C6E91CE|nr:zinc-binding dehydrogenase [Microbacterium trichothecenolyticum]MBW9122424.1 zinc-binding dehydrogenase [Microbacterium trichothecenolyticum]
MLPTHMRAVQFTGSRSVRLAELAVPAPEAGEALVQITMSAVCGSDLPFYRASVEALGPRASVVPGHEPVGVVRSAAPGGIPEGTRVLVYHHSGEGRCEHCLSGEPMFCTHRQTLGNHRHGADAEWLVAPDASLVPLPDDIDDAMAALIACNFGTAFAGLRKSGARWGDRLIVTGLGSVGLCVVVAAVAAGCRVIAVDPIGPRREFALALGAEWAIDPVAQDPVPTIRQAAGGRGAEVAMECSGNALAQRQVVQAVRPHGTVVLVGSNSSMEIDPGVDLIRKEILVTGSWIFKRYEMADIFRAARRLPQLRRLIGVPVPADEVEHAFAAADSGDSLGKVLIDWT